MRDLDSPIPWSPLHIQIASDNDVAPLQLGRRIGLTPRVILAGTCCDRSRPRENWPAARARYEAAARRSPALSRPCLCQPCPLYDSTEIVSSRSCSATSWDDTLDPARRRGSPGDHRYPSPMLRQGRSDGSWRDTWVTVALGPGRVAIHRPIHTPLKNNVDLACKNGRNATL